MSLPYSVPEASKTKKRCMFRMPGHAYNCRRLGKYVLNNRGYCAPHYDTTWRLFNPEYGQQHDWHYRVNHITGETYAFETCRRCAAVKVHDGLPQSPCAGKLAQIALRGQQG